MTAPAGSRTWAKASIARRALASRFANGALIAMAAPVALLVLLLPFKAAATAAVIALALCGLGGLLVPPLLLASLLASVERPLPGVGVRLDAEHLFLGDPQHAIARADLVGGICVHGVEGTTVELSLRRGGVVRIALRSEQEALTLLRDLGLADRQRTVAHELSPGRPAIRAGGALLVAFASSVAFGAGMALMQSTLRMHSVEALGMTMGIVFLIAAWVSTARRAPSQIVIGEDGVRLTGTPERFIQYSEIASISADPDGVFLVTMGRPFGQRLLLTSERGPRSDALVAELRAALARAERARDLDAPARLELLDRGERSLPEWRDALKRLAAPEVDYRRAGIERDQLVDAASDARADKARRLGAALAVSHTQDEGAIERVRIAVDSLADHEMRSRINEALEGKLEDAALEEVLAIGEVGRQQR